MDSLFLDGPTFDGLSEIIDLGFLSPFQFHLDECRFVLILGKYYIVPFIRQLFELVLMSVLKRSDLLSLR